MKNVNAYSLFESKTGNKYLFDHQQTGTQWCHPVLFYILELHEAGVDMKHWFQEISTGETDPVTLKNGGTFSKEQISYYFHKYLLLVQNGYLSRVDTERFLSGRLSPDKVKSSLANTRQITLEVVDYCNLDCAYCTYGKFYENYDTRKRKKLSPATVKIFLDYMKELLESPLNQSHGKPLSIGFYGGEPLLNVPLIRQVVQYAEQLKLRHNRFVFNITTNGLLLDQYADFLVEHDFMTVISLDGNKTNNSYRVFHDGSESFSRIMENIKTLRSRHPQYFESRVYFNTVFHNRNSISDIHAFFKSEFGKVPSISSLNPSGVRDSMKKDFWKTLSNIEASIREVEDYSLLEKDFFSRLPDITEARSFLDQYSGFVFNDYNELLTPETSVKKGTRLPTGTCLPFDRKVFITAGGKILPCEQIGHQFGLGTVTDKGVDLDFRRIAETYNNYYDRLNEQCVSCANWDSCYQCMFYLKMNEPAPRCGGMMDKKKQSHYLSTQISYLEQNRDNYYKIMKELRID